MLKVQKLSDLQIVNMTLQGGLLSGKDIGAGSVYGLDGKTLVFTSPVGTVTFATPNGSEQEPLTLKEIVAQINAVPALAGYAHIYKGKLMLKGAAKVTMSNTSTAAADLGFDSGGSTGTLYAAPGGSAPALVSIQEAEHTPNTFLLTTDEV